MKDNDESTQLLHGVRIVDWTVFFTGSSATQLLADMGAEVIKVERPDGGDLARGATRDVGKWLMLPHGMPYGFENNNRNKKSITLDLTKEEGRQILYALVAKADVFVQNFRYGIAKKLKMDYKTLKQFNPSLIYANCNGFGTKGKKASFPALDPAIHAASGMMLGIGEAGMPPIHLPGSMSDQITGIMLAFSIMLALFGREKKGIGQEVNVSMLGTMLWVQTTNLLYTLISKELRVRQSRKNPRNPLVNYYCCKDGQWILLALFQVDRYWTTLCRAMDLERLIDDPRFATLLSKEQNSVELVSILDEAFSTKTRDQWMEAFAGTDLIYSPIQDYKDVVNDPQVLENDYITEFNHPALGSLKEIGIPVQLSETPGSIREPAPQLGQHTEEMLINILGFSWKEIELLRDRGIIL